MLQWLSYRRITMSKPNLFDFVTSAMNMITNRNNTSNSSSSPESIADVDDEDSPIDDNFSLVLENNSSMEEGEDRNDADDIDVEDIEEIEQNNEGSQMDEEAVPAPIEISQEEHANMMESFGSSSSKPHPLLVPSVVVDILQYLPLLEVMKCRGVCHLWNSEACRIIQKKTIITFVDAAGITNYLKHYPSTEPGATNLSRPAHLTYQMYKLEFAESNTLLQKFFAAHGEHVQHLILQQSQPIVEKELYWALENYLPNLDSLWVRHVPLPSRIVKIREPGKNRLAPPPQPPREYIFPSVKNFTVGTQSFLSRGDIAPANVAPHFGAGGDILGDEILVLREREQEQLQNQIRNDRLSIQDSLVRLVSSFPNLQSITCSTLDHSCDNMVSSGILNALIQIPAEKLRHLVELKFPLHLNQSLLVGLNTLRLNNLSELSITLDKNVQVPSAKDLLLTVGPHLIKLTLVFPADFPYSACIRLPGHEMRRLKHLTLNRYRWPLDFLEDITGLESLLCIEMSLSSIFPIYLRHEHNLKSLKIHCKDHPIRDSEVVSRITRAFPRLQQFHAPGLNDECLRVIYTDLPYLTDLACIDGEFTDCGISGVSLEVCNDLAETMTYLFVNPDKFRRDLFIGNLTNLTHLRLESEQMTHLSVLFGIVKCNQIEHLYLKSDKLSDAAVESIADQMICSLKVLNVVNCPGVTEAGKFFARERIPNLKVYVSGDTVEDLEHREKLKAQSKHAHYDAFSRRRGRAESPRALEVHRRRLAFRLAHRYNDLLHDFEPVGAEGGQGAGAGEGGAAGPAQRNVNQFLLEDRLMALEDLENEPQILGLRNELPLQDIVLDSDDSDDTDDDEDIMGELVLNVIP